MRSRVEDEPAAERVPRPPVVRLGEVLLLVRAQRRARVDDLADLTGAQDAAQPATYAARVAGVLGDHEVDAGGRWLARRSRATPG